ncbi:unnamed protein product [Phyllotreta striolata]|uniref:CCDC66 domain-containing protein n=1 Tax=Phyllotreta striolata TaxID=444603 RepID=A0A9N9TMX6_PHYSR|nr:unnamed protein product [Phyllotreta striolata]
MHSHSALSLIERKKLQWAKEKEEMAEFKVPWTAGEENYTTLDRNARQFRRSSLPPLYKNQFNSYDKEKEIGGETSGYGSDNPNQTPEHVQTWHQTGYESSSSRDDRPKWSTAKTSELAKFWPPKDESTDANNEPPNWVKRGLKNGEIIVNNTSPAESPEQLFDDDRPQTGSSHSNNHSNYLRGQHIHMDPTELAERERKRQLALAHQYAILQQLNEREKRRQEEKERRIKEEYEEELRIEREQEIERSRKEQESKSLRDKLEKKMKRKQAVEEAMQIAQKEAQLAKSTKNKHNYYINQLQKQTDLIEDNKNTVELEDTITRSQDIETLSNDLNNNLEIPKTDSDTSNELNSPTSPNLIAPQTLALPAPLDLNIQRVQYALLIPAAAAKILCHAATQTDESAFFKSESAGDDESKGRRRGAKERRSRSESLEERPKWGVNRPPTRYVKQSDKDPLYRRRQQEKQEKASSDDSRTATPRSYRKKGRTRHSRIDWRAGRSSCRAEVVPLGYDKERLYYERSDYCCICRCGRHKCSE